MEAVGESLFTTPVFIEGTDDDAAEESSWTPVLECFAAVDVATVAMAEFAGLVVGCYLYWCVLGNLEIATLTHPSLEACVLFL